MENLTNLFNPGFIDKYYLRLADHRIPLLAGEVQFFRMRPEVWEPALIGAKKMGLPMVSTYLSWRRFEKSEGKFDFEGRTDGKLNVKAFLNLCHKHGLYVTLKPGPWICAEEKNGGYPDWLVNQSQLQVLNSHRNPVLGYNPPFSSPIPSYFHPDYQKALKRWLKAVDDLILPYLFPNGPIVLIQLYNEPSYTFHDRFLESDYNLCNTGAGGFYQKWLASENLSADEYKPPKKISGPNLTAQYTAWARFKEWSLAKHVNMIGQIHQDNGVTTVPFSVNYNLHPQLATPNNWDLLEKASGLGGFDYYPELPMQWSFFTKMVLAVSYSRLVNRIPWSPEIMTGIWNFEGQAHEKGCIPPPEYLYLYLVCLAFGLKGMNFYMLADRDNWIGSPIDENGELTEYAEPVSTVTRLFNKLPGFLDCQIETDVFLHFNHTHAREAFVFNEEQRFAGSSSGTQAYKLFEKTFEFLLQNSIIPNLVDEEVQPFSHGTQKLLITFPAGELSPEVKGYLSAGGEVIAIVPKCQEHSKLPVMPNLHILCEEEGFEALRDLVQNLSKAKNHRIDNSKLIVVSHACADERIYFIINPTNEVQETKLSILDVSELYNCFNGAQMLMNGSLNLILQPRSVQAFRAKVESIN